jgi:CheY-like chemotaxis protein
MALAKDESPDRKTSSAPTRRVLIVEDDARLARGLGRLLRRYDVATACSGSDALLQLRDGAEFDAILCDLGMPGMSGIEFYDQVRIAFPGDENRIIFMTGGPLSRAAARFMKQVPNPILEKPFSGDALELALASHVQAP